MIGGLADELNHKETTNSVIGTAVVLDRLEVLEQKFEGEKRQWQKEREVWHLSFLYLRGEIQTLNKEKETWQTRCESLQKRTERMEKSMICLQQKMGLLRTCDERDAAYASTKTESEPKPAATRTRSQLEEALVKTKHRTLMTRSDDINAVEPAIDRMNQRPGEVGAEVEALKNYLNSEVQALKSANAQQDHAIHDSAMSTFVRWGFSHCPGSAEVVYAGVAGGGDHGRSHHHHQSLNREGRWDTTDDFATSFLYFSLFSTAL